MFNREYKQQNKIKEVTSNDIEYNANLAEDEEIPETEELQQAMENF